MKFENQEPKKCKKCFLTPDMCGAKNNEGCDRIYESKWGMRWAMFKDFAPIVVFVIFLVLGVISTYWYLTMDLPFPW